MEYVTDPLQNRPTVPFFSQTPIEQKVSVTPGPGSKCQAMLSGLTPEGSATSARHQKKKGSVGVGFEVVLKCSGKSEFLGQIIIKNLDK